jgi:spore coat protein H
VFIAVEEPDGRYAKSHFPDGPDGNLYKEMWPRTEQTDEALAAALETNEDAADVSDMKGFASTIAAASESSFLADMAPWIDVDTVLRYIAVDRALKNWDGITAFYAPTFPHNYYWYHDSSPKPRFHLIPWDLDNTFQAFDPFMHPQDWVTAAPLPDWNSHPANCDPRPVWTFDSALKVTPPRCDPFLDLLARTSWPRFTALGEELLAGPLKFTTMNAKVAQWLSALEPLVADDPTLDASDWIESASTFPQELRRTIQDFKGFLAEGLIDEAPQGPSLEALNAPTEDDGLHMDGITNFEFANAPIGPPAALWSSSDPLSTIDALTWNTTSPLSGRADLRFDFTFRRSPGTYDEWVNLGLGSPGGGESDLRSYTSLVFQVVTDRPRRLRVRIASPAYDDVYGGIWQEFGVEFGVSANPSTVSMRLADFTYPAWAKASWVDAQGFGSNDEAAWALVMSRCNGLILVPQPSLDGSGELIDESEPGYLQIDNVYSAEALELARRTRRSSELGSFI